MTLQPGVLVIAGAVAFALMALPLGLSLWGRLLLVVTMPAWLGPIVIRFRQTQPRSAEFASTPLDGSGSPADVNTSFDDTRNALTSRGFVEVGRLRQINGNKALGGFVQLLEHPETHAVCSRLIIADSASGHIRADVLVFVTERTIGPLIVTSSSQTLLRSRGTRASTRCGFRISGTRRDSRPFTTRGSRRQGPDSHGERPSRATTSAISVASRPRRRSTW